MLTALEALGATRFGEDVETVQLMRGYAYFVYLAKDPAVPVASQLDLLRRLGYEVDEYLAALPPLH